MFKNSNRGISTLVVIGIIAVLVVVVGGGYFGYQYISSQKNNNQQQQSQDQDQNQNQQQAPNNQISNNQQVITSPKAGDTLYAGKSYTITWAGISSNAGNFDIYLTSEKQEAEDNCQGCTGRGTGIVSIIATSISASAKSFDWNVPSMLKSGNDYHIVIQNNTLNIRSDKFAITKSTVQGQNLNLGTILIRAIVVNIDEVGNKYGSYGMKFSQPKITEVDQSLQKLNTFVKQSSYGKTQLKWTTFGVYELGKGVCDHTSYGDKVNDLIQRALIATDLESPITDYSFYLIVHPMPDCSDGQAWSFEGRGQFVAYTLNGRTVHLRGIHISDLSDQYLFHEFGHSLAYKPNTGIGHPDYLNCPVVKNNEETKIEFSNTCPHIFNFYTGDTPTYTMMSTPNMLSDYSSIEKEIIGWIADSDIVTTTSGQYTLSPLSRLVQIRKF